MKISSIKESGSNNLLKWAIQNGADLESDPSLVILLNDQMFYLVTVEDVNFLELFRLTQVYRNKLRIINEHKSEVPSIDELHEYFNGYHSPDKDKPESDKVELAEIVKYSVENFINLGLQMSADDDIIQLNSVRLFIPMIARRFDIQIPIQFAEVLSYLTPDDIKQIFTTEYPLTLNNIDEKHSLFLKLKLDIMKGTTIIKYSQRYETYLKGVKYRALTKEKFKNSKYLYWFNLLGFHKEDNINKGECRCELFNSNAEEMNKNMKAMYYMNTPLWIDFAIQLPIQYMQVLENSFDNYTLPIRYESSMANIVDTGIPYEVFNSWDNIDPSTLEETEEFEKHENSIAAYKVRIAEATQLTMNSISILLSNDNDVDVTSTFSMLPSIYSTKAVISVNMNYMTDKFLKHSDPVISSMFADMNTICKQVMNDISKTTQKQN